MSKKSKKPVPAPSSCSEAENASTQALEAGNSLPVAELGARFVSTKPRSEWKKPDPATRARGCITVEMETPLGIKRRFEFTLSRAGLRVHRVKGRRSSDKVWPFSSLANGATRDGQMELFTEKTP